MTRLIVSFFLNTGCVCKRNFTFDAFSSKEDRSAKKTRFNLNHGTKCYGKTPITQRFTASIAHATVQLQSDPRQIFHTGFPEEFPRKYLLVMISTIIRRRARTPNGEGSWPHCLRPKNARQIEWFKEEETTTAMIM